MGLLFGIFCTNICFLLYFFIHIFCFTQWVLYCILHTLVDLNESFADKALQMFFTTISTRTAGFNCIDLSILNCGILVLQVNNARIYYLILRYILKPKFISGFYRDHFVSLSRGKIRI